VTAFSRALDENGIAYGKDELKAWKGASKREVIRHFVEREGPASDPEQVVETTFLSFRDELSRLYREQLIPIAGAEGCFSWCRDRGILIATTTGFYREESDLILDRMGWRSAFAANISSSDVPRGRPAPYMIFRAMEATGVLNAKEVINVGDTPLDLQSGNNAGLAGVIGVLTGAHNRENLELEPHTHILNSVADLPELIEKEF
jgi:phosphonatase-like hydrolase